MQLNLEKASYALNLHYLTEGDEHCAPGWLQFKCPYCQDGKYHLGWSIENSFFNCWACGGKPLWQTLVLLSRLPEDQIREICKAYLQPDSKRVQGPSFVPGATISLPPNTVPLMKEHKAYMVNRGFIPKEVGKLWNVQATSYWGNFPWRLVIPIFSGSRLVSYILRSIRESDEPRYWRLRKSDEVVNSKELLYGWDLLKSKRAVVVEGPMDAWRMGAGSVAIMGLGYSPEQVNLLGMLDQIFILFDAERGAYKRAKRLARKLAGVVETEIISLHDGDPADLTQTEANNIMKELNFR